MVEALGWAAFVVGFAGTLVLMSERGYRDGMRTAWFLASLAVPGWFTVTFRSLTFDAVSGVALATLVVTFLRPFPGSQSRWVLSDLLLGAVVLAGFISDAANRMLIPGTVLDLVRTWVFPYLLGRLCLDEWDRMGRTLRLVVALAVLLSLFALVEAIIHTNLLAVATGKKWELLEKSEGFRWGLKRAQVIADHPIYFGLLMALTLPWLLAAARAALRREAPEWWVAVPVLAIAAAFITVSRSAHLAILMVLTADLFFRRAGYRLPMIVVAIAGGVCFLIFREQILDLLGAYAGEEEVGQDRVMIYGFEYEYTGTRHRDLLSIAYQEAIEKAGWFGYGTTFPSPNMPVDPFMDRRFKSIDHHYLLHFLKYGYLGTAAFLAFALSAAWNLGREAIARDGRLSELAGGLFGAFVAVIIMVRGVALHPDFGATWLFVAGLAASMVARRRPVARGMPAPNMTAGPVGEEPRPELSRSGA
jgi:hypothetical protein